MTITSSEFHIMLHRHSHRVRPVDVTYFIYVSTLIVVGLSIFHACA